MFVSPYLLADLRVQQTPTTSARTRPHKKLWSHFFRFQVALKNGAGDKNSNLRFTGVFFISVLYQKSEGKANKCSLNFEVFN